MTRTIQLKTNEKFPVDRGETLMVRDGQGRVVERWTCIGFSTWSNGKSIQYEIVKV